MKQLVLLHGMDATSRDQWLPYVREQFEARSDWTVIAPDIPNSSEPDLNRWTAYVESLVTLTPDTVLVGHSAGCPLIIHLIERSSVRITKAILVAGFISNIGSGVESLIKEEYDWKRIKQNCASFVFINSDNDPYGCDDTQGALMRSRLGGTQIIIAGEGHFGTSEFNQPYPSFPLLIKLIE